MPVTAGAPSLNKVCCSTAKTGRRLGQTRQYFAATAEGGVISCWYLSSRFEIFFRHSDRGARVSLRTEIVPEVSL